MCTVTVLRLPLAGSSGGRPAGCIRLGVNRDEARSRPAALPPEVHQYGARYAIHPIDPVGGGTWIAVNDVGLVATLLNAYTTQGLPRTTTAPTEQKISRGTIIPQLMHCLTLADAVAELDDLTPASFWPFRVLITDGRELVEFRNESHKPSRSRRPLGPEPLMFTSSGLGDAVVDPPRRELFDRMVTLGPAASENQDAYHRHRWPDRPDISVCMSRPDARTVSYAVVETTPKQVIMWYDPDALDHPVAPVRVQQPRQVPQ